jgi:uncharacterized protein YlxW (UPF0749 family)
MMAFLIAMPTWMKLAIGSVVLIGVMQIKHMWTVRGLTAQITKLEQAVDQEKTANAELRVALSDLQASQARLQSAVNAQNAAITSWQQRAKRAEASAASSALRALTQGERAARDLRAASSPVGAGPERMNTWLTERFSPQ